MPNNNEISIDMALDIQDFEDNLKRSEKLAKDTGKQIDQATVLKMRINIDEFEQKIKKAQMELKKLDPKSKEALKLRLDIKQYKSNLTEAKRRLNNYINTGDKQLSRLQKKFNQVGGGASKLLKTLGGFIGVTYVFQKVSQAINFATDSFRSYQTAFTGFRKTLNATEPELVAIEKGIVNMSRGMPKSVEELSKIAEIGGQMGIAAKDILQFTKVVAQLSTAIDGVSAEEAAQQLARLQAQTGASIETLDRLGASLVELGNNFKTNEGEILNFADQIKAAAGIVGLSAEDVLGISTAFTDAGINAEAGGTAVTKALLKIDDNVNQSGKLLGDFAKISGMSKDEFVKTWKDDSANAFANVLNGISKTGTEANATIDKLFGTDIRLKKSLLAVANAGGTLEKAIKVSNKQFIDANALVDEYNKKIQTQESRVQINENRWKAWSASMGETFGKVKLLFSDLFLDVIPGAFATVEFGIKALDLKIQNGLSNIAIGVTWLAGKISGIFAGIVDISKTLGDNFGILGHNISEGFKDVPGTLSIILNKGLEKLTGFINKGVGLINSLARKAGLGDLLSQVTLPSIDTSGLQTNFREFKQISFDVKKQTDGVTDSIINKFKIMKKANEKILQSEALRLDKQRKLASREKAINDDISKIKEGVTKNNEESNKKQIKSINSLQEKLKNLKDNLSGAEIGSDLFKSLQKEIVNTSDELDKAMGKTIKSVKKVKKVKKEEEKLNKESIKAKKEEAKTLKEGQKIVQDYYKEVAKGSEKARSKLEDLQKKVEDLNKELGVVTEDKNVALAERKLEILSREKEIQKELNNLKNEGVNLGLAESISQSSLNQSKGDTVFGGKLDTKDNLQAVKDLNKELLDLKNESTKLESVYNKEVFDELQKYKSKSKTEQILVDYEQSVNAIEGEKAEILKSLDTQQKEYDKLNKLKTHLESTFTEFLKIETDKRVSELNRVKQAGLEAAAALRSAGVSGSLLTAKANKTTQQSNSTTINQTNNFTSKITRSDVKKISNDISKATNNAATGIK